MTRVRALAALFLLPLLLAAFAACGGGGDTTTDTVDELTPRPRETREPGETRTPLSASRTPTSSRTPRPIETETPDEDETATRTSTEDPEETSTEEPTETATENPDETRTPRPDRTPGDPGEQYSGSPISGGDIETAFYDAGFDVTSPDSGTAYSTMSRDGFTITAEKDGHTFTTIVFIYPSPDAMSEDWKVSVGSPPEPQDGVQPPGYLNAWWNNNTVVLITQNPDEALRQELLAAYLTLP